MCLGRNTIILLADGSKKPIGSIRIGERVMSDCGGYQTVTNVWQGLEKHMLHIKLKNGFEIILTSEQPVKTTTGVKRANMINEDDEILMGDGSTSKIASICCIKYDDIVNNLELSGNFMIAEGILVGDFEIQNRREL